MKVIDGVARVNMEKIIIGMMLLLTVACNSDQQQQAECAKADLAREYATAFKRCEPLANKGYGVAQAAIANMYLLGNGVKQDSIKALEWYKKAASSKQLENNTNINIQQITINKTTRYFATYSVGKIYYAGVGVTKDYEQAFEWFLKAAEDGMGMAQFYVGFMYLQGNGKEKNPQEAVYWLQRAANQGINLAQAMMGSAYQLGWDGKQDLVKSYMWFTIALAQKDPILLIEDSQKNQIRKVIENITLSMTSKQISQAKELASKWKAQKEAIDDPFLNSKVSDYFP